MRGTFADTFNTILSMVENLDAVEPYIIRQDDDKDEAVED